MPHEDNTVRKSIDDEATEEFMDWDEQNPEDVDVTMQRELREEEDEYWDRVFGSESQDYEDYEDFTGLGDEDGD